MKGWLFTENERPDRKGLILLGTVFLLIVTAPVHVPLFGHGLADTLLTACLLGLLIVPAIALVKALGWTRARRDDEWL
ncbi:MAG: hypothetical protein WBG08_08875 [Litorimonas sp.]